MCDLSEPPNQQDALSHGPYRKPKPPENLAVRDLHRHEEQSHTGPREHKVCVCGGREEHVKVASEVKDIEQM